LIGLEIGIDEGAGRYRSRFCNTFVNTLSAIPVLAMSDQRTVRQNVRQTSVCRI